MFHLVSYKWIRRTQVIPEYVVFYKNVGILLGVVSDCEKLSGGYSQEMMGLDLKTGIHFHNHIKKYLIMVRKIINYLFQLLVIQKRIHENTK